MTKNLNHFVLFILYAGIITFLPAQFANDVYDKYTSVGQLGLAVTNFGVLGNGWNKINGRIQPSCQYKQKTEILREQVEHFSYAGLWIGGKVNGQRRVSTAIVDGVFDSGQEGFEFFSNSGVEIRSSISSTSLDSMAQYFSPFAVSHQDLIMDFKDYGVSPSDGYAIPNHNPLGIDVHLESYAWNFTFADAFVILNYTIKNSSSDTINNIYGGLWMDASVANMNYTSRYEPGGGFTWTDNLDGFDRSVDDAGFNRDIAYQYDADGDDGWAESYIGVSLLGGTVPLPYVQSHYSQWAWTSTNNSDYPQYGMPLRDEDRYEAMKSNVPKGTGVDYTEEGYPAMPDSWLFLHSAGPFGSKPNNADSTSWILPPGDSCKIVMTIVCARWNGATGDSPERRKNLHVNNDWAQKTYDGEDINRNNILDDGEDLNDDGKLTRYILPEPPPVPNIALKVDDREVTIYWQNNAESFVDPISQEQDFEGYHIYGARKTLGDSDKEFTLLGEFDLGHPDYLNIGYNTGFDFIRIVNAFGEQDSIEIDGNYYHYQFVNKDVKNGWLNYYAVTAYDRGDPNANLQSLESSVYANRKYVYPGIKSTSDWAGKPTVYPNPYRGQAKWDGSGSRGQQIWFQNIPEKAEIRIFSLAGDLVEVLNHTRDYIGEDIQNIDDRKNPQFSGGEHAWDLITRHDQAAATGLYLFTVENLNIESSSFGEIKEGKFLIIK
ncbi:MAG: hypothetical protein ACE5D0_07135 [Fidelibacterota bacterium]